MMRVVVVAVCVIVCCFHWASPESYLRSFLTSAGDTMSPVLLFHELRSNVTTAASSTSDNCLNDAIAVPGLPLNTILRWPSFGPFTSFEPDSAGNAGG